MPRAACDLWHEGDSVLDVGAGNGDEIGAYLEIKYGLLVTAIDTKLPQDNKQVSGRGGERHEKT